MTAIRKTIIDEHIDSYYPNAKTVEYTDSESGLEFFTADALQGVDKDWFPLSCHIDPETGKAVYGGREKIVHTYTEGETGAGKTTRFVIQSVRALSSMKNKPSFVLVDIHGEIIENLYTHLIENGYDIKILNCDNPRRSDTFNPFAKIVEECLKNGKITDEAEKNIRRIAEMIQPIESTKDPIWDIGARSYCNGCILDKVEDVLNGDLPPECVNLYNIIQNHYWIRRMVNYSLFDIPHYKAKGTERISVQKIIPVTDNAEKTRASYFGVVENHYDEYGQQCMYDLSSNSTINVNQVIEKPTVIVIQTGNSKIGDVLISLLVNEIYTEVVKEGKKNKNKMLPRKIHCFLDEFANMNFADGPDFVRMLTTSRKFGMYWHMILQCDAQLDRKYDEYISRIIRANCTELFMGSNDYETETRFARSCGQRTIESLGSEISHQAPSLTTVDLMSAEKLNLTDEGFIYVKSGRHHLLKTYFEAFYKCDEFVPLENIEDAYPINSFDYTDTQFYPTNIPPEMTRTQYRILQFLDTGIKTMAEVFEEFGKTEVREELSRLLQLEVIAYNDNEEIISRLSSAQIALVGYKLDNDLPWNREPATATSRNRRGTSKCFTSELPTGFTSNPFDFDFEEETEDNASFEFDCDEENALLTALKAYLSENNITVDEAIVDSLTSVPDALKQATKLLLKDKNADIKSLGNEFANKATTAKFEIIEAFIAANNCKTKKEWVDKLKAEIRLIKRHKLYSGELLKAFENALFEVSDELTLSNIKEIKKLISGNQ